MVNNKITALLPPQVHVELPYIVKHRGYSIDIAIVATNSDQDYAISRGDVMKML